MRLKYLRAAKQFLRNRLFVSPTGLQAFAGIDRVPRCRYVRVGGKWEKLHTNNVRHALLVKEVVALSARASKPR